MLISNPGLVVSLPANELRGFSPSGSIFAFKELRVLALSAELSTTLDLVRRSCEVNKVALRFVARPEIFTHGAVLEWLKAQLGAVRDHLCLSDGTTIRPIPEFRNHLFLYRLGIHANASAFERLCQCAPELPATMFSQVNTWFSFGTDVNASCPAPVLLQADRSQAAGIKLYRLVHRDSAEKSAQRTLKAPVSDKDGTLTSTPTTYVPLTETACNDTVFLKAVGAKVAEAAKQGSALLFCIPNVAAGDASIDDRLLTAIRAVQPLIVAAQSREETDVIFASGDLLCATLKSFRAPIDLMIHSSFQYWSHPPSYYQAFRSIELLSPLVTANEALAAKQLLTPALGREPTLRQLSAAPYITRAHRRAMNKKVRKGRSTTIATDTSEVAQP